MQKIKDFIYYNRKEILLVIISIIGILCLLLKSDDTSVIEENNLSIKEIPITEEKETNKIIVDIKGEINSPGTYEMDYDERIIDQTTPNMIQKISEIFARNPLISSGL